MGDFDTGTQCPRVNFASGPEIHPGRRLPPTQPRCRSRGAAFLKYQTPLARHVPANASVELLDDYERALLGVPGATDSSGAAAGRTQEDLAWPVSQREMGNVCPALWPSWFLVLISTPGMFNPFLSAHPLSFLNTLFPVHTPPSWTPSPTCPHILLPACIPLSRLPSIRVLIVGTWGDSGSL